MIDSPVPVRQVLLAYTLLATVLISAWVALLQPAWERYQERHESIDNQRHRLNRLEHAVANDVVLNETVTKALIESLQVYIDEATLHAPTADVGGSLLKQILVEIVESHHGKVGDTRVSNGPEPSMITVSLHYTIDLTGLKNVLYDLAAVRPFAFVNVLSIRAPAQHNTGNAPLAAAQQLAVQIDTSTFWVEQVISESGS
jgi:hypothetical protein